MQGLDQQDLETAAAFWVSEMHRQVCCRGQTRGCRTPILLSTRPYVVAGDLWPSTLADNQWPHTHLRFGNSSHLLEAPLRREGIHPVFLRDQPRLACGLNRHLQGEVYFEKGRARRMVGFPLEKHMVMDQWVLGPV